MKSINQIFACLLATVLFVSVHAYAGDTGVLAKGGYASYTLHIGKDIITKEVRLSEDSYIYSGQESNIVIADPEGNFYIGIVKNGTFNTNETCNQNNKGNAYTLASYLVYNKETQTMDAIPFDNGFVNIDNSDAGFCKISYMYTLKEKGTGKLLTLKGEARIEAQKLAGQP